MQTVISTGEGSCTGLPTQASYSYPPKPFNLFFMNVYGENSFDVSFFGAQSYPATSLVNSFNNAFTLPTVFSLMLEKHTKGHSENLAKYGVTFFPTKTCYDPSTQTQLTCSLTDFQCVVRSEEIFLNLL